MLDIISYTIWAKNWSSGDSDNNKIIIIFLCFSKVLLVNSLTICANDLSFNRFKSSQLCLILFKICFSLFEIKSLKESCSKNGYLNVLGILKYTILDLMLLYFSINGNSFFAIFKESFLKTPVI